MAADVIKVFVSHLSVRLLETCRSIGSFCTAMLPHMAFYRCRAQEEAVSPGGTTWKLETKIAEGYFGSVYVCGRTDAPEKRAVKVVSSARGAVGECAAESARLRHHNLVNIQEIIAVKRSLWVLMEFCGPDDLFSFIGKLSDSCMLKATKELLCAVSYLHARGFVHRDIKPENVAMVAEEATRMASRRLVLLDLGSMRPIGSVHIVEGTAMYQAPEARHRRHMVVDPALDAWSSGATLATVILSQTIRSAESCRRALIRMTHRPTCCVLLVYYRKLMATQVGKRATVREVAKELSAFHP